MEQLKGHIEDIATRIQAAASSSMALAGYWDQFPVPLESPPTTQIHAAF